MWEPREASDDDLIHELAELPKLVYAKRRTSAAKKIGIGVGDLDKIVIEARSAGKGEGEKGAPALYNHWTVEPWPEPVDGSALLRAIKDEVRRYVFMSEHQAVAVTLLTVLSWLHEHMTHSVITLVTSPEKNSGNAARRLEFSSAARAAKRQHQRSRPVSFDQEMGAELCH